MALNYVDEIAGLAAVTTPFERPEARDWIAVEAELNFQFPSDYRELISQIGGGEFGSGFYLRNPCSASEYVRLSRDCLIMHREPICDLEDKLGFPLYPSAGGHIAVGSVGRQDFYFPPDSSGRNHPGLVGLNIDLEEVRALKYSLSQFIHDLYHGLIGEGWAEELRENIWCSGDAPFFTPRRGHNPSE